MARKIKVITCLSSGVAHQRTTIQNEDLPSFIEAQIGSGRRYIAPPGTHFQFDPVSQINRWLDLSTFVPPPIRKTKGWHVLVSESNAFAAGDIEYTDEQLSDWVTVAEGTGTQDAVTSTHDDQKKQDWLGLGAGMATGVSSLAMLVMAVVGAVSILGEQQADATQDAPAIQERQAFEGDSLSEQEPGEQQQQQPELPQGVTIPRSINLDPAPTPDQAEEPP